MTKILLVDDEDLILHSLSKALLQTGADVTTVTNGKDGLNEIKRSRYDICFLDVQLPDASGLDLMKIIREISPLTKLIIMTAVSLNKEQLSSLHDFSCHYLPKPFDLKQVHTLLSDISGSINTDAVKA